MKRPSRLVGPAPKGATADSLREVRRSRWIRAVRRPPALLVVIGFASVLLIGTVVLMLPMSSAGGRATDPITALFTATSALCVTGLIVVDTPVYWSSVGEMVILGLIQLGGLGIMTLASLLSLLVFRRFGLRMQLTAQTETKTLGLGEVRRVVARIVALSLLAELVIGVLLTLRLTTGHGRPLGRALYEGAFHAVSAFNNAGFSLYSDNIMGFVGDPWFCLPLALAVICGGIGFPVLLEVARRARQPRNWSLHTKVTLTMTAILLTVGTVVIVGFEWTNPGTLGPLDVSDKFLAGFVASTMARTAGFNSLDIGEMTPTSLLLQDILMFIGGGSAGTAGGIKVTTFALLGFVILAEVRGEPTVHVMGRKLPGGVQRQALTVVLLGVAVVVAAIVVVLASTTFDLDRVQFEVISAFATVGLSTGITGDLPGFAQVLLAVLMFLGRIGPITLASALALRERVRRYELPEERPIVG